jgi:hypothetical protein
MDVMVLGAGGGGGKPAGGSYSFNRLGGGAAGRLQVITNLASPISVNQVNLNGGEDTDLGINIPNVYPKTSVIYLSHKNTYYVRPGASFGAAGEPGFASKFLNIFSVGGLAPSSTTSGAASYNASGGTSNNSLYGGGGGGQGGNGGSVTAGPSATQGGTGGPGRVASVDGNTYGRGGNGNLNNTIQPSLRGGGGNYNAAGQAGRVIIKFYE